MNSSDRPNLQVCEGKRKYGEVKEINGLLDHQSSWVYTSGREACGNIISDKGW